MADMVFALVLKALPARWRDSVARDLLEEARFGGRRGLGRTAWLLWQTVRVAARLRFGRRSGPQRTRREGFTFNPASDLRFALRTIRREPWTTGAIVLTLALGVGATTAVYAVFNYAVFRPVPGVVDDGRLVSVYVAPDHGSRSRATMTHEHLVALRQMPAFDGIAGYGHHTLPFRQAADADPRFQALRSITRGYFQLLGATPAIGRLFAPQEYERPESRVAVISERFWRSRYAGSPAVLGQSFLVLDVRFEIIGVVRSFHGLDANGDEDVWIPFGARSAIAPGTDASHQWLVGRLAPDVPLDVARQQAATAIEGVGPIEIRGTSFTAVVYAGLTDGIGLTAERLTNLFRLMMAGVSLLFLLACANAANLLLSRNLRRRRELALKTAIGASRVRVLRELAVEAGLLSLLAAAVGLNLAAILGALFRADRLLTYLPTLEGLTLDWRVAVFSILVAATTVFVAAGLPALTACRWQPWYGLRGFARGSTGHGRLRGVIVAMQVALSVALLCSAGVLTRTLQNLQTPDLGFDTSHLLTVPVRPRTIGYDDDRLRRFLVDAQDRLSTTTGIDHAAFAFMGHLEFSNGTRVRLPGDDDGAALDARQRIVSAGYFDTVGIPLLAGRTFSPAQARAVPTLPLAIIDDALARRVFPG